MKKTVLSAIVVFISTALIAQHGGSVVVEIKSITCQQKSYDGVVEFDGPGNEVFVSGAFFGRNPTSNTFKIYKDVFTTSTYGSIAGHFERLQAGTASSSGGIDNNNTINLSNVPIASTQLDPDGFVLLTPTVWERDDNNDAIYNRYKTQILADLESASLMPFPRFAGNIDPGNPFAGKVYAYGNAYHITIPPNSYPSIFNSLVNPNAQGNRPMGIVKYEGQSLTFDPTIVLIEAKNLWAIYNQTPTNHPYPNAQYPWKTVKELSIYCGENTYGIDANNGKYLLNIVIRFAPEGDDITAARLAAQNPVPVKQQLTVTNNSGNKTIIPVKGVLTPVPYTMNNEMMYGQWKGSKNTNGEATKSSPLAFKINNGAFWLLDASGTGVASGGFKIENNNFVSTYTYANGDSYTISSATYNPSNGELSGTWVGNGVNANKKGNWLAVKQSN